ncbi:unnamed protein product [Oncorhynchus mykiss]|uniref:B box-type domain-containing protein n=1 Tax=Oncorhynchus mykiss TaxID=8022 RepID=A0A060WDK4_ONCMY|nr:unnamed protein product [Oncorhynchus mykiss]
MATAMESISCSICLDLLKDPVTLPCGHSYCMGCIKDCWNQDDQKGTFIPRPVLKKSTMLAELVENLKKTGLQAAPPAHYYAGPGDKHNLVKVSTQLEEKICSRHDKLLEMYCRTDQQFICLLCVVCEHKGHDTVSAESERTERQSQLGEEQQKSKQRIQRREKEIQEVRQAVKSLKNSAQAAVEDSEKIFTELIRSIERRCSEVKEQIRAQEKVTSLVLCPQHQVVSSLFVSLLELKPYPASLSCSESIRNDYIKLVTRQTFWMHLQFVLVVNDITCQETRPEPKTREEFLEYSCQLTLDPNTA